MTTYLISAAGKPWLTVFSSPNLDAVAEAIAAQLELEPSSIYASLDGKPRPLSENERMTLFRRVRELKPDDGAVQAQLAAAFAATTA
jgi:hypothetical protein